MVVLLKNDRNGRDSLQMGVASKILHALCAQYNRNPLQEILDPPLLSHTKDGEYTTCSLLESDLIRDVILCGVRLTCMATQIKCSVLVI